VEQDTLEDLGFSLDLIYLANGLGQDQCSTRPTPPEVEEMEKMLEAVLNSANAD